MFEILLFGDFICVFSLHDNAGTGRGSPLVNRADGLAGYVCVCEVAVFCAPCGRVPILWPTR